MIQEFPTVYDKRYLTNKKYMNSTPYDMIDFISNFQHRYSQKTNFHFVITLKQLRQLLIFTQTQTHWKHASGIDIEALLIRIKKYRLFTIAIKTETVYIVNGNRLTGLKIEFSVKTKPFTYWYACFEIPGIINEKG